MKSNLDTRTARFFDVVSWYALCGLGWIAGIVGVLAGLGMIYCIVGGVLNLFGIHLWFPTAGDNNAIHHGCINVGKSLVCH